MKIFDKIKQKRQEKIDKNKLEKAVNYHYMISSMVRDMYDLDTYSEDAQRRYDERYKGSIEVYGKILRQPKEFKPYVERAHEMDAMAIEHGLPNFLWDTVLMARQIEKYANEFCSGNPKHEFFYTYLSVMPKFSECQELLDIFIRFYEKNEIEYNKEFYGQTIWDLSLKHHAMPLLAVMIEHIMQTHELPYPAFLAMMNICHTRPSLKNCKVAEDGLHLVKCSEYEFNEITGDHWANLSREEKLARALKSYEKFKPKD